MPQSPTCDTLNIKIQDPAIEIIGDVRWSHKLVSGVRIGAENTGPIKGHLKNYKLADIIFGLYRMGKTGILHVKQDPVLKKIYIKNGDLIFSASNQEDDRLGRLLLRSGKISPVQYYQSIELSKKTGKKHGTILVELGYITPEELIWAVKHQVEEIILSLFGWEDGEFNFIKGPLPTDEVITLKLSAANLIYRGIKRIGNLAHIKDRHLPVDAILYFSPDPLNLFQDITLDEADRKILSFIDGKRKIKEILSISPLDNLQTLRTLYALISTRIIETREKGIEGYSINIDGVIDKPQELDPTIIASIEDTYSNYQSLGYYGILGLDKWATDNEIKKAYYKMAKKFHPDRHFYLPSDLLSKKLNSIFTYINEAYHTLLDPKKRKEYDQTSLIRPVKIKDSNTEIARSRFEEGDKMFKRKNYADAAKFFGQAVYLDSSIPDYHYYHGLALSKTDRFKEAESALYRAIKLDPFNADYIAELGYIYLQLGFKKRAKTIFEKAIKFDPSNERAIEGLRRVSITPNH